MVALLPAKRAVQSVVVVVGAAAEPSPVLLLYAGRLPESWSVPIFIRRGVSASAERSHAPH